MEEYYSCSSSSRVGREVLSTRYTLHLAAARGSRAKAICADSLLISPLRRLKKQGREPERNGQSGGNKQHKHWISCTEQTTMRKPKTTMSKLRECEGNEGSGPALLKAQEWTDYLFGAPSGLQKGPTLVLKGGRQTPVSASPTPGSTETFTLHTRMLMKSLEMH